MDLKTDGYQRKTPRSALRLSEYEFNVVYPAETKHQTADALSSLPTTGEDLTSLKDDLPILAVDVT